VTAPPAPAGAGRAPAPGRLAEAGAILRLAAPVAVAQVGMLTMGLVDTWFVGQLGPIPLAAVALAGALFFAVSVVAMGAIMALDPLVSQAFGARDAARCAAAWRAGRILALGLAPPLFGWALAIEPILAAWGDFDPRVVRAAGDYVVPLATGALPFLLFAADRSFLHGLGDTRPAMVVAVLANVVNALLDYALIFGEWGAPAFGVAGSGLATGLCRWFMLLALHAWIYRPRYAPYRVAVGLPTGLLRQAVRLGAPIGLTHGLEVGAFAAASVFMGLLGVVPLAAHQVAIKMASTTFMLAIALGTATGIRVGQAVGAGRPDAAARSGAIGLGLGLGAMAAAAVILLTGGRAIMASFTDDPEVVALGATLLAVAAAFQLSDGTQAIAAGALRGVGDTIWPMFANLGAHWLVGLPVGGLLVFQLDLGPTAVWWALASGLTVAAVVLVLRFRHVVRSARPLAEGEASAS